MSDAPPMDDELDTPPEITSGIPRQYPATPMPSQFRDDMSEGDDSPTRMGMSVKILIIAIAIAHFWTVWTLRADMNIVMQFLQEITQQNKHVTDLLHNQHQVKWQIVPSQL